MIDLKRLISDAADAFGQVTAPNFPPLVGNGDTSGNEQGIDRKHVSHLSQVSHHELLQSETKDAEARILIGNQRRISRGIGGGSNAVGKVGTVGNASNGNPLYFPLDSLKVGKVGKDGPAGGLPAASTPTSLRPSRTGVADHADTLDQVAPPATVMMRSRFREVEAWQDGIYSLHSAKDPCPGYRLGEWRATFDIMHGFLETQAEAAHELGWTALELFAVNRCVGVTNIADCGALVLVGSPVLAIERDFIRFRTTRFMRWPVSSSSVLIWESNR